MDRRTASSRRKLDRSASTAARSTVAIMRVQGYAGNDSRPECAAGTRGYGQLRWTRDMIQSPKAFCHCATRTTWGKLSVPPDARSRIVTVAGCKGLAVAEQRGVELLEVRRGFGDDVQMADRHPRNRRLLRRARGLKTVHPGDDHVRRHCRQGVRGSCLPRMIRACRWEQRVFRRRSPKRPVHQAPALVETAAFRPPCRCAPKGQSQDSPGQSEVAKPRSAALGLMDPTHGASPVKAPQGETHLAGAAPIPNPAGLRSFWNRADRGHATIRRALTGRPRFVVFAYPGRWPGLSWRCPLRGAGESILSVTLRSPLDAAAGRRMRRFHPFGQTAGVWMRTPSSEAVAEDRLHPFRMNPFSPCGAGGRSAIVCGW